MMSTRSALIALIGLLACGSIAHAQSQSWDKVLSASRRFVVLDAFAGEAVLDKETGLVWERTPGDVNADGVLNSEDEQNWFLAQHHCRALAVGNRRGWRLPSPQELASLSDPSVTPALPIGHPFNMNSLAHFWSAGTDASTPTQAYAVAFSNGRASLGIKGFHAFLVWCVRGGPGIDPQ